MAELEDDEHSASYLRGANLISRTTNTTEYYTFNAHGDVVGLVNVAGTQTKTYDYDAFGNEKDCVGSDPNPFRYCGEYFDVESGAYYLRARYYDPGIGRFTQEDTHWNAANMIYGDEPQQIDAYDTSIYQPSTSAMRESTQLYVYCSNNAISFVDSFGYAKTYMIYYDSPNTGFEEQALNSPYYDVNDEDVILIGVVTDEDFIAAWNSMEGDIDYVYLYLHGGEGCLYFKGATMSFNGTYGKSFYSLNSIYVNKKVYLFSCSGGAGDESNNVAWMFSRLTSSRVSACTGSVSYSRLFGKYLARASIHNIGGFYDFYYEKMFLLFGPIVPKRN